MNIADISNNRGTYTATDSDDFRQVKIAIGGDGKTYLAGHPHFEVSAAFAQGAQVALVLPDSVAEYFRQQGRRQLQSELRHLLNVDRKR